MENYYIASKNQLLLLSSGIGSRSLLLQIAGIMSERISDEGGPMTGKQVRAIRKMFTMLAVAVIAVSVAACSANAGTPTVASSAVAMVSPSATVGAAPTATAMAAPSATAAAASSPV